MALVRRSICKLPAPLTPPEGMPPLTCNWRATPVAADPNKVADVTLNCAKVKLPSAVRSPPRSTVARPETVRSEDEIEKLRLAPARFRKPSRVISSTPPRPLMLPATIPPSMMKVSLAVSAPIRRSIPVKAIELQPSTETLPDPSPLSVQVVSRSRSIRMVSFRPGSRALRVETSL